MDNSLVFFVCPIGAALAAGSIAVAKKAELGAPSTAGYTPFEDGFRVNRLRVAIAWRPPCR